MYKRRARPVFIYPLQVYFQFHTTGRLVSFRIRQHFCAEQGDDVITDNLSAFIAEIGIVDTEVCVEPVDFGGDEFRWDEALCGGQYAVFPEPAGLTVAATSAWTKALCSSFPLNTGVVYPGRFLTRWVSRAEAEFGTKR